jgi:hypothetical protein
MFYVPHLFPLLTISSFQIHGFMKAPLRFMHLRNVQRLGKNAVLQLGYLLEAAPFLVNLHVDVRFYSICLFSCFVVVNPLCSLSIQFLDLLYMMFTGL